MYICGGIAVPVYDDVSSSPPPTTISCNDTIFMCCRKAISAFISRSAMTGSPSFQAPLVGAFILLSLSVLLGNFICFNATIELLAVDELSGFRHRAFQTIPYDPSLIRFNFSYVSYTDRYPSLHSSPLKWLCSLVFAANLVSFSID